MWCEIERISSTSRKIFGSPECGQALRDIFYLPIETKIESGAGAIL
jgi:hypothetical protein